MKSDTQETMDYGMFKTLPGNRPPNEGHVLRLMASFQRKYLKSPILVNNEGFVIDGQHRLEAAKRLGLPVWYRNDNNYTLEDAQILNSNNKVWNKRDYLGSFCELGWKPYLQLKEFMEVYPQFGIATAIIILTDQADDRKDLVDIKETGKCYRKAKPFEEGKLTIKDLGLAYENAGKLTEYGQFFLEYNSRSFVRIMVSLFHNPKFKHDLFLKKLQLQPMALRKCATHAQYRILIEDIYNYKSHSKVNLRY
jgi:hypothetical protein